MARLPENNANADIGRRITQLRTIAGISAHALARQVSAEMGVAIQQTQVVRIEAGERPLRAVELPAFAQVLGVSVGDLLGVVDAAPRRLPQSTLAIVQNLRVQLALLAAEVSS